MVVICRVGRRLAGCATCPHVHLLAAAVATSGVQAGWHACSCVFTSGHDNDAFYNIVNLQHRPLQCFVQSTTPSHLAKAVKTREMLSLRAPAASARRAVVLNARRPQPGETSTVSIAALCVCRLSSVGCEALWLARTLFFVGWRASMDVATCASRGSSNKTSPSLLVAYYDASTVG